MSTKPKQTAEQKKLAQIALQRERELRVENARETTKAFSDNVAFRRKLRGIFSLLSGGFKGFPGLGVSPGRTGGTGSATGGVGGGRGLRTGGGGGGGSQGGGGASTSGRDGGFIP